LKAAVLNVGGLSVHGTPRPEVDYVNFTPRVTIPVLMLNGRYDLALLYESEVQPMYELLGTPDADKKHVVEPTGHFVPFDVVAGETLDWLDRYLGPAG
jgi:pimeloyl-ACP methyl ester carboxylesterase